MAPTILITGVSSGLGLLLAEHALKQGATVIGTVRNPERASSALSRLSSISSTFHEVALDVTNLDRIATVMAEVTSKFGQIDVLVNNAGYSIMGPVEEISVEESKTQMDTCYFGPLALIKAVLPQMRKRRSGTIVNVTSVAGLVRNPGVQSARIIDSTRFPLGYLNQTRFANGLAACGLYAASKFALEGTSESLAVELAPFKIRIIAVEPGAFRTEFLSSSNLITPGGGRDWIIDYQGDNPANVVIQRMKSVAGKQPGNPQKAAERIWDVIAGTGLGEPVKDMGIGKVLRVLLGSDSLGRMKVAIEMRQQTLEDLDAIAKSCDY